MMRSVRRVPYALGFTLLTMTATAAADRTPTLPIQRVVLYKHGVGYFERQGTVNGSGTVSLRFKQDEMSDVLKSLTVFDRSGGKISSIAYDSQKPPSQLLSEFAFDLRTTDVRKALFQQLRGARVRAEIAGRDGITGAVLGLDSRTEVKDGAQAEVWSVSLLTDAGDIVTVDLGDLRSFRFEDEALAAEVTRYLSLLRTTHRRDEKEVQLVCDGTGDRQVFAAYVVAQPVWKATYRLVLFDQEQPPYLQGWAVVDNPSEDDWVDVDLSLVSGMPVSFRQDLYTPRYRERPLLEVQEDAMVSFSGLQGLGKVAEGDAAEPGGIGFLTGSSKRKAPAPATAALRDRRAAAESSEQAEMEDAAFDDGLRSQQAETISREIGDLLEYRIDHKVTIHRNRSALLPIVTAAVEGGRVALYNESARRDNPMSAVRVINTTGVTLEGGPITVLEGDTYAGESMIDTLKPNERRYIPYAVELGVKATTEYGTSSESVFRVEVSNGLMRSYYKDVSRRTYSFDNRNDAKRVVLVEHLKRNGFALRAPQKPKEDELDRYRFEIEVAAKSRGELVVAEERVRDNTYQLTNIDSDTIAMFQREGRISKELEQFLREVVAMKAEIAAQQDEQNRRNQELAAIAADQDRVRKNLAALGSSAEEKDLRRDYVEQLRRDEDTVKRLKDEVAQLANAIAAKRLALDAKVRAATFSFEP